MGNRNSPTRRLHVTGLVRQAQRLRQAITNPLTSTQRDELAREIRRCVQQVDELLTRNGASPRHLPDPSRRAYEFLKQVDLTKVAVAGNGHAANGSAVSAPESVSFRGLRSYLDHLLDDIAMGLQTGQLKRGATLALVRQTRKRLDHVMQRDRLQAAHLKPEARHLLAWFRTFAEAQALDNYIQAVERAQCAWSRLPIQKLGWHGPLLVHFRPSAYLYRYRAMRTMTRIVLDTPMISFDEELFEQLGRQMLGSRAYRQTIMAAMMAEEYQTISVHMEAAVGVVEQTRGVHYDLANSFDRVNRRYFHGKLPRPRLTWNRRLTGRKFGHYDFIHDTIMISTSLDSPEVPEFVVDHVMHHELLHKKHGFCWHGSRRHTHTPEFREEEKTFERFEEADRFLNEFGTTG